MMLKEIVPIICISIAPFLHSASTHKLDYEIVQGSIRAPGEQRYYALDSNYNDCRETKCSALGRIISGQSQAIVDAVHLQLGSYGTFSELSLETAIANILAKDSSLAEPAQSVRIATGPLDHPCNILLPAELQDLVQDVPVCDQHGKHCSEHAVSIRKIIMEYADKAPTKHVASLLCLGSISLKEHIIRR